MKEERALLTPLQSAFNDGVEAAKTIIREHSTEGYCEFDYWRASLINAIARKTNPHAYRADIADERVKQARREVWEKAWLLLHEVRIFAEATGRERNVISSDRRELLKAFEAARAAEGEGE